jgi:diguanylate cyclase (GGDEF)-like protein
MATALSAALLVSISWVCLLLRRLDIERAKTDEILRGLTLVDDLTKLLNRRGFLDLARQQLAQRNERSSLVCFIDLDGLKGINDTLGHEVGDRAIAAFARVLRGMFRESDVLARLGGDEFVVLAVDSSDANAIRARLAAELAAFNAGATAPFELAASVGTALSSPSSPANIEALLHEADANVYAEKQRRKASRLRSVRPLAHASKRAA